MKRLLLIPLIFVLGCNTFVSDSQKGINSTAILADGAMSGYGAWWKDQIQHTNVNTASMWQQRTNIEALSIKAGAALAVAQKALTDYQSNAGTNSQAVVSALLLTAVQDAGALAAAANLIMSNNTALVQSTSH